MTPEPPTGSPPPAPGGGGGPRPSRTRVIAVLTGTVALVASGLGAYALAGGFSGEDAPPAEAGSATGRPATEAEPAAEEEVTVVGKSARCMTEFVSSRCFPSLHLSDVTDALTGRGFECAPNGTGLAEQTGDTDVVDETLWVCDLNVATSRLEASVRAASEDDDRVRYLQARVAYAGDGQPSSKTMEYLSWFAALPYANDQPTVDEVTAWLAEAVQGGEEVEARIGGFDHELEFPEGPSGETWVWLTVDPR